MSQRVPRIDQLQVGELDYRRSALATLSPSLADVERVAVLQVEMKMGAVHVVGLGPKHRENSSQAPRCTRRRNFASGRVSGSGSGAAFGAGAAAPSAGLFGRCLHHLRFAGATIRVGLHVCGRHAASGAFRRLGHDRHELYAGNKIAAGRTPALGEVHDPTVGEKERRKIDGVGVGVLAAALVGQIVEVAAGIGGARRSSPPAIRTWRAPQAARSSPSSG